MFMYLHFVHTLTPPSAHTSTHRYIDTKIYSTQIQKCIHRQKDRYKHIFRTHHSTIQCNTIQRSTVQYSTIQDKQYATPRFYSTTHTVTHTDKHAVHYVDFVSFPYLRLPALHCIMLHYTTLRCITVHFTALQSIALHYAALQ